MPTDVDLLTPDDCGEVLTLQRAPYVTEAQVYGDPWLPALVQTAEELRAELATGRALGVRIAGRLVGAVRTREDGHLLHVNRLTVTPDQPQRVVAMPPSTAMTEPVT